MARALIVFAVGATAGFVATSAHIDAVHAARRQVSLGRYTTRFTGRGGAGITAASCEAAGAVAGVRTAGGFTSTGTSALSNGARVQLVVATAGFVRFLLDGEPLPPGRVLVGREAAEHAGIRSGAPIAIGSNRPVVAQRLPATPRADGWPNTVFTLAPPTGLVQECWVEIPSSSEDALASVEAVLDGARPLSRGPVDRDAIRTTAEETRAGTLSPWRAGIALGSLSLVVVVLVWWSLREEWALYVAIGFGRGAVGGLALVDWTLLALAPAVAGVSWGSLAAGPTKVDVVVPGRMILVAGAVSSLAVAWLRAHLARMSLRRTLAGL